MINLKHFDSNLLKIDKKHYRGVNIYHIGYITIKKKSLWKYLHTSEYIEENYGNKYLIFDDSVNENKALLKKYEDVI